MNSISLARRFQIRNYFEIHSSQTNLKCAKSNIPIIMLTGQSLKSISSILKHACFCKVIPFDWDSKTYTVRVIRDWRIVITFTITIYLWTMSLYLGISYYRHMGSIRAAEKVLYMVLWTCYLLAAIFAYNTLRRKSELLQFINHFFSFEKQMGG